MLYALTVRQPWAWAIIHGGKLIENRTTRIHYTGPVAIHAATSWSARGATDERIIGAANTWLAARGFILVGADDVSGLLPERELPRGVIIGTVDLVGCHPDVGCCRPW